MTEVWTHATFTVKRGREEEFAAAWTALARRARADFGASPTLVRARDPENVYLGFGSWPDVETMHRFREASVEASQQLDELLERGDAYLGDRVFP